MLDANNNPTKTRIYNIFKLKKTVHSIKNITSKPQGIGTLQVRFLYHDSLALI